MYGTGIVSAHLAGWKTDTIKERGPGDNWSIREKSVSGPVVTETL